jgi:hypothetical protein
MTERRTLRGDMIGLILRPIVKKIAALTAVCLVATSRALAVILMDTGDPSVNTTPPGGALTNSGWQYEGIWGGFLGTPIAPQFFISAAHIGQAGGNFVFQGSTYTIVRSFALANSDLLIWQVNETFPSYAPLYTKDDEIGKHLVVIGRGTERGSEMTLGGTLRGWSWGNSTSVERWGENDVADIVPYAGRDLVYATFDQSAQPNESHLSSGDSGGAVFLKDNGVWKLAGISYSVDDLYTAPSASTQFDAAIFDARGYYTYDGGNFTQISGTAPVPTGFYASRISSETAWIYSVIDPTGDPDGDTIPNLLEYALDLDPLTSDAAGLPRVGREGNFITLTYTKVTTATDIDYAVEQSTDLASWATANTQDEIVSTVGNVQTIKAKIDIGTAAQLFVRLRITRP